MSRRRELVSSLGWRRVGQIFSPSGESPYLVSHASVPFAEPLGGDLFRFWFSPRDALNCSAVTYLVADLRRPETIVDLCAEPPIMRGPVGSFDDAGTMMSWIVPTENARHLYYIGWNTRVTVPFHVSIGLAVSEDGGRWTRSAGPILDRGIEDPWFCSNPCVLKDPDGWRMWYLGGLGWDMVGGRLSASYDIRHARSADGIRWTDRGLTVLPLTDDEFAIARPSVLRTRDGYLMWFSVRTRDRSYRLGAARSVDGRLWDRAPELAAFGPAVDGWDHEMIAYPHVFEHAGSRWMLYCGNGFGRTGFGLAQWD